MKRLLHNLGAGFDGAIRAALPSGWTTLVIDASDRWNFSSDADAAFIVHGTLDDRSWEAAARPEGWPGKIGLVQLASTGLQGYPEWLPDAPQVASARGTNAIPIAEYALAAMLAYEKRIPDLWVRDSDSWPVRGKEARWQLGTLAGKTLGLIGSGAIGTRIAELAQAFGMHVLAARRSASTTALKGVAIRTLDALLGRADHVVIAAPLTAETRGLFSKAAFSKLKPGAHLVNVARGAIVDTDALLEALDSGHLAAATLDVTEPEPLPTGHRLYEHPRIHISPHIAWNAPGFAERLLGLLVSNIQRVDAGEAPTNLVTAEDRRAETEI